ncbi:hypothetical protein HDR59_02790 [bacterium]|nr:hypothetical protein [bacterium]
MDLLLKQLINIFDDVETFPLAKTAQVDFTSAMLKNNNLSPIPNDYTLFLTNESNGLICDGVLEFFGTEKIRRNKDSYNFPNIVEANEIFNKTQNPLMENSVLLGYNLLYAIIWSESEKVYKIIKRNFFTPIKKFNNFGDVLKFITNQYMG